MKHNKIEGHAKTYYENGQLEMVCFYKDGKRNGDLKYYYKNGDLKQIIPYVENQVDGEVKVYQKKKLFYSIIYKNNKIIEGYKYENGDKKAMNAKDFKKLGWKQ